MTKKSRGVFILFEGGDRCGKTTQCNILNEFLNESSSSKLVKFPNRTTEIGQSINRYLKNETDVDDKAIHLLFSANRWECMKQIRDWLNEGINLVVDRYAYSGIAFSVSKGLDLAWCMAPDMGLIEPDVVILLDVPVNIAEERGGFGEERYEMPEIQKSVRKVFHQLMEEDKKIGKKWEVVNASRPIEEVAADIKLIAAKTIENAKETPIREKLFM